MKVPIFISYGHYDNSLPPNWVNEFGGMLKKRLQSYVDEEHFDVWYDRRLLGNEDIWPRIEAQLDEAQIFVPILSARYVTSESCLKEFRHYYDRWTARDGFRLAGQRTRLFKVVKIPVKKGEVKAPDLSDSLKTALIDSTTGYEFYRITEKGAPIELMFTEDPKAYLERLSDLAFAVRELIDLLQGEVRPSSGAIYLAEAPSDITPRRDMVRRELEERGFEVLPKQPLDWSSREYATRIAEDLSRSSLAVHLVGLRPGVKPDDAESDCGATLIQLSAALAEPNLRDRVIAWVSPLDSADLSQIVAPHRNLVTELLNGDYARRGVEVVESREALWDVMQERLRPAPGPQAQGAERQRIFLICHESDVENVGAIGAYLDQEGFDVLTPAFDADPETRLHVYRDFFAISDAVLLYYGDASDAWFKQHYADLIRSCGEPGGKRKVRVALVGGGETPRKILAHGREPEILKRFGPFDKQVLAQFVNDVRKLRASE
jgi:hypothetical protein